MKKVRFITNAGHRELELIGKTGTWKPDVPNGQLGVVELDEPFEGRSHIRAERSDLEDSFIRPRHVKDQ